MVAVLAAAGAVVTAADLNQAAAHETIASLAVPPDGCRGVRIDVTDPASVAECFADAAASGSAAEIVVNCAGIDLSGSGDGPLHEVSLQI